MSKNDVVLELRNINKTFIHLQEKLEILDNINLQVKNKETVAIIAPSGTGKSTLLQIAGLLDQPTKGEVMIDGKNCKNLDDNARSFIRGHKIGFIYQNHYLLKEFTALENLLIPQMIIGNIPDKDKARELLSKLKLEHRISHKPSELSGGECQRLAIGRALINSPTIVIADEPTGNLDPHTTEIVFDLLLEQIENTSCALLMVTHNMNLISRMHSTLELKEGKLQRYKK